MDKEIITLLDDGDKKVDFFILETIRVDHDEYLLLEETENSTKDAIILKKKDDVLCGIQDADEYRMVRDLFEDKFEEEEFE